MSKPVRELLLHIKAEKLPEPTLEHKFHFTRKWRFDICWPEYMVAVEVQGGVWTQGRHTRGKGYTNACAKLNEAQLLGWNVLWVTADQIKTGEALDWIDRALMLGTRR